MKKLSDGKITIVHRDGRNVSGPLAPRKGGTFFSFFTSPGGRSREKNIAAVLTRPVSKSSPSTVPQVDLAAVRSWVALEEKIIHDYKKQKVAPLTKAVQSAKILPDQLPQGSTRHKGQEKKMSSPGALFKGFSLGALFTFLKAEVRGKNTKPALKVSAPKSPRFDLPPVPLNAVETWVALEEKIIHDYKERKTARPKTILQRKTLAGQSSPVLESFTTQTAVPLLPEAPRLKDLPRGSKNPLSGVAGFLLVCGWLTAGAFILANIQGAFSSHGISQKLTQLQKEKKQQDQDYAALKNVSAKQSAALKMAQAEKAAYGQSLDKKYREELKRTTARYEADLTVLRDTVKTQNAIVSALKAQSQAFEMILDQAGMSALSGTAGFSQKPFSGAETSML